MNTKSMKKHLESCGCTFELHALDRHSKWSCFLDGVKVASHKQLGPLIWLAAEQLGEQDNEE